MSLLPPSTDTPPYASSAALASLPTYSAAARPDERTISLTPQSNQGQPSRAVPQYQYKSGSLTLNLGPKRWGTMKPSYGWNDNVDGWVEIKKGAKGVMEVSVYVAAWATSGLTERGFLSSQKREQLFCVSQTLFYSAEQLDTRSAAPRLTFSIPLPSSCVAGATNAPLPPTFTAYRPGVGVEITYWVGVKAVKTGKLRRNEDMRTTVFYLPRSYARPVRGLDAPPQFSAADDDDDEKEDGLRGWQTFHLLPWNCANRDRDPDAPLPSISLPSPLTYPCSPTLRIPFIICLPPSPPNTARSSSASVSLFRRTTLIAPSDKCPSAPLVRASKDTPIGRGTFSRPAPSSSGMACGYISQTSDLDGERSWALPETAVVQHFVRVCLGDDEDEGTVIPVRLASHTRSGSDDDEERRPNVRSCFIDLVGGRSWN